MHEVVLTGWEIGLQKVNLTKLLRSEAGLSLREAKTTVDDFLAGNQVTIPMTSEVAAEELVRKAAALGALGQVRERIGPGAE